MCTEAHAHVELCVRERLRVCVCVDVVSDTTTTRRDAMISNNLIITFFSCDMFVESTATTINMCLGPAQFVQFFFNQLHTSYHFQIAIKL